MKLRILILFIVCLTCVVTPTPVNSHPNQQEINILTGHQGAVHAVDWSPDGQLIASGGHDGTIRIWDATRGDQLTSLSSDGNVWALAWSPDGRYLASGHSPSALRLWQRNSSSSYSRQFSVLANAGWVLAVDWSSDSYRMATVGGDRSIMLWDLQGRVVMTAESGHRYWIEGMAWSPDGNMIATGGGGYVQSDFEVLIRPLLDIANTSAFQGHTAEVWSVSWSPDSNFLATASQDGQIRVWNVQRGQQDSVFNGPGGGMLSVAWSPADDWIAGGSENGQIRLWNARTGQELNYRGHTGSIEDIAWSPKGNQFATASQDGTVRIWSLGGEQVDENLMDAVQVYYQSVKQHRYDISWNMLTDHFIAKHNAPPTGYADYVAWWDSVSDVRIGTFYLDSRTGDQAIVFAELTYVTSSGTSGPHNTYILLKYVEGRGWLFDDASSNRNNLDTGM
jgi:WD40 repeat protein